MTHALNWKHLDFTQTKDVDWIRTESGLSSIVSEALVDADSRPRMLQTDQGVLLILRGVNLNPDSAVEDMVSVRVWVDRDKVISTARRQLFSIRELGEAHKAGVGPKTPVDFLSQLVERLGDFIIEAIEGIEGFLDHAEENVNDSSVVARNSPFSVVRRQTARIRRYLSPQREALDRLSRVTSDLFSEQDKAEFHEQANRVTLILEDLDLVRERAMVAQEELVGIIAHEQNARMFVLSIVAAIFLPLSFLTGLMGMNVAGLPGLVNEWAFWILVAIMLLITAVILLLFKVKKWF